jgi:hypothetical protein
MSYSEREETNMKKLIIDFYTNDWIFVALCDENDIGTKEKHSICKGLNGLIEFLTDQCVKHDAKTLRVDLNQGLIRKITDFFVLQKN